MVTKTQVRKINKEFRAKDDSSLWPICGAFSVADRAINRARRLQAQSGGCYYECAYTYQLLLENIASEIVNNPKNH